MSNCWKSIILEYDPSKKIASRKFYSRLGSALDDISGTLILKKLIFNSETQSINRTLILTSNISTYYDLDKKTDRVLVEYCPIEIVDLQAKYETKVIELQNQEYLKFSHLPQLEFQLMTLEKKRVDISFSVLLFYKLC